MHANRALQIASTVVALVATTTHTSQAPNDDITGVVTGPNGPEAGVWVIAETSDLPTKYAKIVVTDDRGRYVIPDPLPVLIGMLRPRPNVSNWSTHV